MLPSDTLESFATETGESLMHRGAEMTRDQAVNWMQQVDGRFYHTPKRPDKIDSWVAVVRVPAAAARSGKLIIALGGSLQEAADAAEQQWQTLWEDISILH